MRPLLASTAVAFTAPCGEVGFSDCYSSGSSVSSTRAMTSGRTKRPKNQGVILTAIDLPRLTCQPMKLSAPAEAS